FFFSSRRRHTRLQGDWSSDVCSSDLIWGEQVLEDMVRVIRMFRPNVVINGWGGVHTGHGHHQTSGLLTPKAVQLAADPSFLLHRSEERRVGKECRCRWWRCR